MNPLPPFRISALTGIVAACVVVSACGGGSGGSESIPKSTAAVTPSGQATPLEASAASSPASAASAAVTAAADEAASAPASQNSQTATANNSTSAQPSAVGTSTSTTTANTDATPTALAAPVIIGVPNVSLPSATSTAATSTAAATTTADAAPAVVAEVPQVKAMAETTTTTPPARCTVGETRIFGACKAFASIGISHGETVSFWNTNTGVTGRIAASCNNGVVTWQPGVCSETSSPVTTTTSSTTKVSSVLQQTSVAAPTLSSLQTFVATPPYSVQTLSGFKSVPLIPYGGKQEVPRTHDFVSAFVNPLNQRPNAFTVQTPISVNGSLQYVNLHEASMPPLTAQGSPNRASIENGALKLAYFANDPASSEKLRTQVNSYAIPTRRKLTWDLSFKFGGDQVGEAWPSVKYTTSPVLIWQVIQNKSGYPPMVLLADTDPADSNKLLLILAWRSSNTANYTHRWTIAGLNKNQYHDLIIQSTLDERDSTAGGQGMLRMWINGQLAADLNQRTLFRDLDDTYRWVIAVYQTNEPAPIALNRVMKWRRARMMVTP